MKKQLLLLLIAFLSLNCYSQIAFEKGYYIDNTNKKNECFIKNIDWKYNPTEIEFKLSENSEPKTRTIKSIREFGIYSFSKYIRDSVNIDRSSEKINNISRKKNPIFEKEQLFLKVLVEGNANLYQYFDKNLKRYFYNVANANIEQLVFKSYKVDNNKIAKNYRFRQQLWNDLKCPNLKMKKIESVGYNKKDLVRFFTESAECNDHSVINFEPKQERDLFNLTLRPRLNSSSLTVQSSISSYKDTNFDAELSFGLGFEAEYFLPFNKNKWALAIEPTYQYFKSVKNTRSTSFSGDVIMAEVDYSSIELPLTLRYYFYFNEKSKLFINASLVFDLETKSSVEFTRENGSIVNTLDVETQNNYAFGIGYKYIDRYSFELRLQSSRDLFSNYVYWSSKYNSISLIFGYSFN